MSLSLGKAIRNNIAATTCSKPVIGRPYPPKMIKQSATTLMIFDDLNIVFIVYSIIELSENIESMF
jgi:hypothetical protein